MRFFILSFILLVMCTAGAVAKQTYQIALTVNDDPISQADIENRARLVMISSGMQNTASNRERALDQASQILIDEMIKMQEAARYEITINDEQVQQGFDHLAAQNKMTSDEFAALLARQGIPQATILQQMKADLAWREYVTRVLRGGIKINENDVNARLDILRNNIGREELNIHEIFFPIQNEKDKSKVRQLAVQLRNEIKAGRAPFQAVAMRFSGASSAAQGGNLGWMTTEMIPEDLRPAVIQLQTGEMSNPVEAYGGYYILKLHEKRILTADNLPSPDEVLNQIGLERLDRLQKRTLSDMRSTAFIEKLN